jgi:hypothetical protein
VVCVRDVDREVEVAPVERAAELIGGGVRDPPVGVGLVSESGVCDQAIERRRSLGYGAARLQQNGHPVVPRDVLQHSRRQPLRNDRAKSKTATGALDAHRARWDPSSSAFLLGERTFKDSDGGFRRA